MNRWKKISGKCYYNATVYIITYTTILLANISSTTTSSQALPYVVSAGRSSNHPLSTTQLTYTNHITLCANVQFNSHPDVQFHFPTEVKCSESLAMSANSHFKLQSV